MEFDSPSMVEQSVIIDAYGHHSTSHIDRAHTHTHISVFCEKEQVAKREVFSAFTNWDVFLPI